VTVTTAKPPHVFGRDREWAELDQFATPGSPGARLAVVYGRRRQGKSFLLQDLVRVHGGFYWEAAQQSRSQNLEAFSNAWATYCSSPGRPRFMTWSDALEAVFSQPARSNGQPNVVVFDEVGYLVETATEFPSILQRFFGPEAERTGTTAMIVCGSVMSHITRLFSAGKPLRGRQTRNLRIDPFGYRESAEFWGLAGNPDAAFRLHALIGGTPAYRRFADGEAPKGGNVDRWAVKHLLNPASPLFQEGEILVAEDPTLVDKALYWSVLNAIADGQRRRGDVAEAIGRPSGWLTQSLNVLVAGAWIEQRRDPLHAKASTLLLTDPILRTHRVLIAAERFRLERGNAQAVWDDSQTRLATAVYAPHLEWMAADWLGRHASSESAGGTVRLAGPAVLRSGGRSYQLDVVVSEPGPNDADRVCAVGEVKAENAPMGEAELHRLDEVIGALRTRQAPMVKRLLVARRGFTAELKRTARRRGDIELIDLDRLYDGT
jgi:uncharacterized protein